MKKMVDKTNSNEFYMKKVEGRKAEFKKYSPPRLQSMTSQENKSARKSPRKVVSNTIVNQFPASPNPKDTHLAQAMQYYSIHGEQARRSEDNQPLTKFVSNLGNSSELQKTEKSKLASS